ncbi:hypothetical protein [Brevibacterium litoralis]|uniref:hypothetical protein n=1 Tax=Brevibacterium litoralis TaxID=3138935 RepID=UPI0032EAF677
MTTHSRSRLTRAVLAGGSAVALAALAACGGGQTEAASDTSELRIAYAAQPSTLDPHLSTAEATFDYMRGVYEGLTALEMTVADWPTTLDTMNSNTGWELGFAAWSPQSIPTRYTFMSQQSAEGVDDEAFFGAIHDVNFSDSEAAAQEAMARTQEEFYRFLPMVKFGNKSAAVAVSEELAPYDIQSGAGSIGIYYNAAPTE